MTDPGAEAPIRPVLGGKRRIGERARILAVGAVAVLVFGMGIGLAGNGVADGPATTPPATGVAAVTASPRPSPTEQPSLLPPTQNPGLGCAPVRLGAPAEVRISSDAGNLAPVTGLRAAADPTDAPWPLPDIGAAARLTGSAGLLLAPDGDACVRYVIAEYEPSDPDVHGPFPIAFRTLNVSPPRTVVPLGPMPTGDWIVRIVTYFSTGIAGQENANVEERFFRVISGQGAGPLPTPATPPAVPCASLSAADAPPDLVLEGTQHEGPMPGIPPGTGQPELVYADVGAPLVIRGTTDACARSWAIQAHNVDSGLEFDIEIQENPTDDPFRFAQNRWRLLSLPSGLLQMTATMRYSADVVVTRRWSLIFNVADFPVVEVHGPDDSIGTAVVECGVSWSYPGATGGVQTCGGSFEVPGDLPGVTVPAGVPVSVEAPGWTIVNWGGSCGTLDGSIGNAGFKQVDNCDLGGSLTPGTVAFLPRSGAPLVRLFLVLARDDGVTATGVVYTSVAIAP